MNKPYKQNNDSSCIIRIIKKMFFLETRQRGRFAGFSLYISNTGDRDNSSLCYKDGPELPALNFSTECMLSGRYIIFYNERLDGVTYSAGYNVNENVYTELCEVTVKGKLCLHYSLGLGNNVGFKYYVMCS